ncbi:MAG: hypothetical protein K2Y17_10075 [Qipengyuania sp.]|nr:hypothetical protein [Qipengyuania sp.]
MATAFSTQHQPIVTNLRLIHPIAGPSIRTIGAGSGSTSVVKTPSYRYREGHAVEGRTEMLLEKHDEVVADVIDSRPQPFMIEARVDGERAASFPDRARLLRNGTRQLVECKDSWPAFFHPKAFTQGLLAKAAAEALGWDYVQIVPSSLGSRQFQANVDRIYACRGVHVPDRLSVLATQILSQGPVQLGTFTAQLHSSEVNGFAIACAMMVRQIVEIELDKPLGHSSLVRNMGPTPRGLPSIRFNRRHR